jgi:hypothetical protein
MPESTGEFRMEAELGDQPGKGNARVAFDRNARVRPAATLTTA